MAADNPTPGQDPANEPGQAQDATPGYGQQQNDQQPPWGEDFQPDKAWSLVQNLRGDKQKVQQQAEEYRQSHEALQRILSDPEAQTAFLSQLGYDVEDDTQGQDPNAYDPNAFEDGTPGFDPRVDELAQWKQQQEAEQNAALLSNHIDDLAQEAGVKLTAKQKEVLYGAASVHMDSNATEQLAKSFFEDLGAYRKSVIDEYVNAPRAPRAPAAGVPGSDKFDPTSRDQRIQQMAAAADAAQQP